VPRSPRGQCSACSCDPAFGGAVGSSDNLRRLGPAYSVLTLLPWGQASPRMNDSEWHSPHRTRPSFCQQGNCIRTLIVLGALGSSLSFHSRVLRRSHPVYSTLLSRTFSRYCRGIREGKPEHSNADVCTRKKLLCSLPHSASGPYR
jgi:hypothetical protein